MSVTQTQFEKALAIGWVIYQDSTYTAGSPLSVASAKVQLTNDGLGAGTNKSDLPEDVTDFWDSVTNTIISDNEGASFDIRLQFTATSSAVNTYFDVTFDIGGAGTTIIAGQTKIAPKGIGVPTRYTVDIPIFSLATFIANGCKIYLDTSAAAFTLSVYDIYLMVKRDYKRIA